MSEAKQPRTYLPINGERVPVKPVDPSDPTTHPPGSEIIVDDEGVICEEGERIALALPEGFKLPDKPRFGKPVVVFESQQGL